MALRDLFKRKKPKKVEEKKEEKKEEIVEGKKPAKKPKRKKRKAIFRVLKAPHITEKATELAARDQYVFRVETRSNKTEIKKEIEQLYDVDVLAVRIINVSRRKRTLGRISGWRKGYKKAIVRIKQGQKIEGLTP